MELSGLKQELDEEMKNKALAVIAFNAKIKAIRSSMKEAREREKQRLQAARAVIQEGKTIDRIAKDRGIKDRKAIAVLKAAARMEPVCDFVEKKCITGMNYECGINELYKAYVVFSVTLRNLKPYSLIEFIQLVVQLEFACERSMDSRPDSFLGIALYPLYN